MTRIRKLLVANRGEIAVRIFRTARAMGVRTVAIYSEADAQALHVAVADEAVPIGKATPAESYLDVAKVVGAARASGADAIHPGYGFLSERPELAEACADAGIVSVGPPAEAMRRLGDKASAKALARQIGVPIVPGFFEANATREELRRAADAIGYPVLLKAAAGGGGRGMREVAEPSEFERAFDLASDEAYKAFGDGAMMVERRIVRPRHIEVQVLADAQGQVACLFERECSLQRRHQKVIEEAPAPIWTARPGLRWEEMREAARALAAAAGYRNAGTVEFIVDEEERFYFLEVNARLQVEHPVTESITGLDLVREQMRIAEGAPLQADLLTLHRDRIVGHAIEARVVAEDPAAGFAPSVGRILAWSAPSGPGIRVDGGFEAGSEVSRYYDSLLAKVVASGADRDEAIARLRVALEEFHVLGVRTNVAYLLDILATPAFAAGRLDTEFLARELPNWSPGPPPVELAAIVSAAGAQGREATPERSSPAAAWEADGFRNAR